MTWKFMSLFFATAGIFTLVLGASFFGADKPAEASDEECHKVLRWAVDDVNKDSDTDEAFLLKKCSGASDTYKITRKVRGEDGMEALATVTVAEPEGYTLPKSGEISRYWRGQKGDRDGHVKKGTGYGDTHWQVSNNFAWSHDADSGGIYPTNGDERWILLMVKDDHAIWCDNTAFISAGTFNCTTHPSLLADEFTKPFIQNQIGNAGRDYLSHRDELWTILADRLGVDKEDLTCSGFFCGLPDPEEE